MKKIGWLILILLLHGVIYSYSILDAQNGDEIIVYDARSAAMGNTGITAGSRLFNSFLNPANLVDLKATAGFQYGMNLLQINEKRSLPIYNSFDAYSGEATYVDNLNYYAYHSAGIFYNYSFGEMKIGAASFYHPLVSFDANYFEEIRNNENSDYNNYPPILAKNYIDSEGAINAYSGNLAFQYKDTFSLGVMISKLAGDSDWERKIIWQQEALDEISTLQDTMNLVEREYDAFQLKFGANYKINERLAIGLSFQPETDFDVSGKVDGVDVNDAVYMYYSERDSLDMIVHVDSILYSDYLLPAKMRAGISYQPRNIMKTHFNIEIEHVGWSSLNDLYDDQFNYYLGVEHVLTNSIPIRLGFSYSTKYGLHDQEGITFADKIIQPSFSVGSGFVLLNKFTVDLGLQYTNRQYEALDLFMDSYYDYPALWENYIYLDLQDRGWENPDTVKEKFLELKTSISYKW